MDIADLRSFIVVARYANLRSASADLHQSPSALSKAIKRLEIALNTPLFDRVGKSLRLNSHGEHLRERAMHLIGLTDQLQAEFRGERQHLHCRIVGPAILQWRFGPLLSSLLQSQHKNSGVAFESQFEDAAISALARGEADFALATGAAVSANLPAGLEAVALESIIMQLAAGKSHPILKSDKRSKSNVAKCKVNTAQLLHHDFACPDRSLFCGIDRGARSDGWRDDQLPRRIRFWLDDLQLLMALVRSGQALAYLPDFALDEADLVRIHVTDCVYECVEQAWLIWRPGTASGWQNTLIRRLPAALTSQNLSRQA
jgi:DNA-binding transcriptional LysR family regulator